MLRHWKPLVTEFALAEAGQGVKAVHPYPFVANEDNHILGRFDSEYAYANFPKIQLNPEHLYAAIILDVDHPPDSGWPIGTMHVSGS